VLIAAGILGLVYGGSYTKETHGVKIGWGQTDRLEHGR